MFLRSTINSIQIFLKLLEAQAEQKSFHPDDFDLDALPLPSPNHKASATPRDPSDLDMITVHVTAVKGGFGVSRRARQRWEKRMDDGILWVPLSLMPIARQLEAAGVLRGHPFGDGAGEGKGAAFSPARQGYAFQMLDDPQRIARRLALWERYRSVPYHEIATRAGDVLYNRRLAQRSWHGNGGNVGAGLALDMHPSESPGDDFALTGQHALNMLADRMAYLRKGAKRPPIVVKVTSHRQHKHPGRAKDPGKWASENVVVPVVSQRDDLVIAHGLVTGSGRPWPRDWDPASPYDMRGRRVDGR